jgi:hypothetical protein
MEKKLELEERRYAMEQVPEAQGSVGSREGYS